jgi:hypothetical protein
MPVQTICAISLGPHYYLDGSSCWSMQILYMLPEGSTPRELVVLGGVGGRCERTACVKRWRGGFLHQTTDMLRKQGSVNERHLMKSQGTIS